MDGGVRFRPKAPNLAPEPRAFQGHALGKQGRSPCFNIDRDVERGPQAGRAPV